MAILSSVFSASDHPSFDAFVFFFFSCSGLRFVPILFRRLPPAELVDWLSSELLEARFRFLQCLKAEYFKAKREGKLGSSGKTWGKRDKSFISIERQRGGMTET